MEEILTRGLGKTTVRMVNMEESDAKRITFMLSVYLSFSHGKARASNSYFSIMVYR